MKYNFPLPSITAKSLVLPPTSLAIPCKSDLLSLLPSCKCPLSPPLLDSPPIYILIYMPMISNLYLHDRSCFRVSCSHDLLLWISIPRCPTNTLNSLSFPLTPLPPTNASSSILYLHYWFHHPPNGPKQKPPSYASTPAFPSSLHNVTQVLLEREWREYNWKSHFLASFAASCDHIIIQANKRKARLHGPFSSCL